jgi:putative ABC transport system ATP-binding protein
MEELSDIHKRGNTIIMVTHNPDLTTYASRVITMLDGKIASDSKDTKTVKPTTDAKRPLNTKALKATTRKTKTTTKKKRTKK